MKSPLGLALVVVGVLLVAGGVIAIFVAPPFSLPGYVDVVPAAGIALYVLGRRMST